MQVDLKSLGVSEEKLLELVVESIVRSVMYSESVDDEGRGYPRESQFSREVEASVTSAIDAKVEDVYTTHLAPKIGSMIDEIVLQKTNEYGEKKGEPKTFIEYLTDRADAYLTEPVDHNGKPIERSAYSSRKEQTRLTHLVHEYLHYAIKTAMEDAVKGLGGSVSKAIEDTVKIKLAEFTKAVKVTLGNR